MIKGYILDQIITQSISKERATALLQEIFALEKRKTESSLPYEPVAIIGMACRFPGADDPLALWELLRDGVDMVRPFPSSRQTDVSGFVASRLGIKCDDVTYLPGGYLEDVSLFPNEHFRISPGEATKMDPQQRLFLEVVDEALEAAGISRGDIAGSKTSVFAAYSDSQYKDLMHYDDPSAAIGTIAAMIAGRIAYAFDLHGEIQAIDTTCSSALVAVHAACMALQTNKCQLAIAGGAKLTLYPADIEDYGVRTESQSRRCKSFSQEADGIISGEGACAFVFKRLSDALKDDDTIFSVITGAAVNSDGRSNGIASPNALAQTELIDEAWKLAGINGADIGYIEAHGSGTKLGDAIEASALAAAFKRHTTKEKFCAVGSIKSSIGHTDSISGIAGLMKAVLTLIHHQIPPSLHAHNDILSQDEHSAIFLAKELIPWTKRDDVPRICGISSFGLSGTNCHIVVQEFPETQLADLRCSFDKITPKKRNRFWIMQDETSLVIHQNRPTVDSLVAISESFEYGESLIHCLGDLLGNAFEDIVSPYSASLLMECLRRIDEPSLKGEGIDCEALIFQLQAGRQHERLIRAVFHYLTLSGYLVMCKNGRYKATKAVRSIDTKQLYTQYAEHFPQHKDIFYLLEHCITQYPCVFQGTITGLEILYPSANVDMLDTLKLESDPLLKAYGLMIIKALRQIMRNHNRNITILEVGGGFGTFTRQILDTLKEYPVTYLFTDISQHFVSRARKEFAEYPFVRCEVLDIEKNITQHNLKEGSIDIVVGFNAIHVVDDVVSALSSLKRLLKKDGLLLAIEDTVPIGWAWAVWGLTDGWWRFKDTKYRQLSPLLDQDQWENAFKDAGFKQVISYPQSVKTECSLIVGSNAATSERLPSWFSDIGWKPVQWQPYDHALSKSGLTIIFQDEVGIADQISKILSGQRIIWVAPGDRYEKRGQDHYTIHPGSYEDIQILISDLRSYDEIDAIFHLWPCCINGDQYDDALWEHHQNIGSQTLFNLAKVLEEQGVPDVRIVSVIPALGNSENPEPNPSFSTLMGLIRVIPQEWAKLSVHALIADIAQGNAMSTANNAIVMLDSPSCDAIIAVIGGVPHTQEIRPLAMYLFPSTNPLRENGEYLILGGTGYLGLQMCHYMAQKTKARFHLIGRTHPCDDDNGIICPNDEQNQRNIYQNDMIANIRALGSQVMFYQADVGDINQMRHILVNNIGSGSIHGVINAVKHTYEKRISDLRGEEFRKAIDEKHRSVRVVEQVLEEIGCETYFYILLSSISSLVGGHNRAECAAANAFLDQHGSYRNRHKKKTVVFNIAGIALERPTEQMFPAFPVMNASEFTTAFEAVLERRPQFVIFEDFDFAQIRLLEPFLRIGFANTTEATPQQTSSKIKATHENRSVEPEWDEKELPQLIESIWSQVLGYNNIAHDQNFFEINGDSLMAIKLFGLIKERLHVEFSVADIFTYPTISKQAHYIVNQTKPLPVDALDELLTKVKEGSLSAKQAIDSL